MLTLSMRSPFYLSLLLILSLAPGAAADDEVVTTQLTEAQAPTGAVRSVQVSPDNTRVVYLANQEVSDRFELYSREVTGGPITRLNPPLPMGGTVESFGIAGSRVVFVANPNQAGSYELFSVPLAGGMVTPLSGPLANGGDVAAWRLDPAGSRVAFFADPAGDDVFELFSVDVDGGPAIRLAGPSASGGTEVPNEWHITSDGTRVAFVADHDTAGLRDIYTVPLIGGEVVKLSGDFTESIFSDLITSPDGSRLVFAGDLDSPFDRHLYSVPVAGGEVTRLTPDPGLGDLRGFDVSPDSSRVVYNSDQEQSGIYQIYSVPITGGTAVRLNDPLVNGGDVTWFRFLIDSDPDRLIYSADQDIDGVYELFSAPVDGGGSTKIHENLVAGEWAGSPLEAPGGTVVLLAQRSGQPPRIYSVPATGGTMFNLTSGLGSDETASEPMVAAASNRALFLVRQDDDSFSRLFSATLAGDSMTALSPPPAEGGFFRGYVVSPDGAQVFYRSEQDSAARTELFEVPITGAVPQKVNAPFTAVAGSVFSTNAQVSENAERVVTLAKLHDLDQTELYSAALDGSSSLRLSGEQLPDFAQVLSFVVSPDGHTVLFQADAEQDGVFELFSVPIQGGTATRLNNPLSGDADVDSIQISPNSETVYFTVWDSDINAGELFSVPITGGTPTSLFTNDRIGLLSLDPSGQFLLFLQGTGSERRLFRLPTTGGTPTELNGPLEGSQRVVSFQISPNGIVVYRVESNIVNNQGVLAFYSVPVAGGDAVAISDPDNLFARDWFRFTPDHNHVLFLGESINPFGPGALYAASIDGSTLTRLSAEDADETMAVLSVEASPDSTRVVYLADQETDLVYELYSVPLAGGTPIKLHPDLSGSQDAGSFEITPDSSTVIYRSDIEDAGKLALYSSPIGGGGSTRITPDFPEPRALVASDFQISHDGRHVFYRKADSNINSSYSLFRLPIGGGEALRFHPEPVGGNLTLPGSVSQDFIVTSDDSRVVFSGDLKVRGVRELWSSKLSGLFSDGFESGDTSAWSNTSP